MTILLTIWFLLWIYKEFPRVSPKQHFKRKLRSGAIAYSQLDFETYIAKDRREELRKEYDRLAQSIDAFQTQVDNKANTPETIKLFEDKVIEVKKALDTMKEKIDDADRGIKLAEDTKDDLHYQENLMRDYVSREL